jgi:hypothetical protein
MLIRPLVSEGNLMSQRSRRQDPYPWTWEIPVCGASVILLVLVCGVHLGRAIANVLAGVGWEFPGRIELFRSLPEILRGDARAGLIGLNGHFPSPATLWVYVVGTELLLIAGCVFLLKLLLHRRGPTRMKGMASPGEAERLLGVTRLRKNRAIIRPDLYRKRRHSA